MASEGKTEGESSKTTDMDSPPQQQLNTQFHVTKEGTNDFLKNANKSNNMNSKEAPSLTGLIAYLGPTMSGCKLLLFYLA